MTVSFARLKGNERPIEGAVPKDEIQKMQERLQKIIARAGIASRRHAEHLILSGQVRVNGRVVTELGTKADAGKDRIEAAGRDCPNVFIPWGGWIMRRRGWCF